MSKNTKTKNLLDIKEIHLIDTIEEDIKLWHKLENQNKIYCSHLYLHEFCDSTQSGMYQLLLNGGELWYGTLKEINAIVKSMIYRLEHNDFLD